MVVKDSSGARVEAKAMPMAASANSFTSKPISLPTGMLPGFGRRGCVASGEFCGVLMNGLLLLWTEVVWIPQRGGLIRDIPRGGGRRCLAGRQTFGGGFALGRLRGC